MHDSHTPLSRLDYLLKLTLEKEGWHEITMIILRSEERTLARYLISFLLQGEARSSI